MWWSSKKLPQGSNEGVTGGKDREEDDVIGD